MKNPLLTFILFGYNQAHYVREAITAALAQTYSPLEIIFSDDCSQDDTFEIMESMAASYRGPHTIVLNRNEMNLGIGRHVNRAFSLATGEWIVTAASDDISDEDRCERLSELIDRYPRAGAIGAGWRRIDDAGRPLSREMLGRYLSRRIDRGGDPSWIENYEKGDFGLWGMSAAWKTEMLRSSPLLPEHVIQEDEVYSFFCALGGYDLVHDDLPLVSYREHGENVSGRALVPDFLSREKHRTAKARMRLATLEFLADTLAPEAPPGRSIWQEESWNRLTDAVTYRAEIEREQASWWDMGMINRLRKTICPARSHGKIARPREIHRVLPYALLGAISRAFGR